MCAVSYRKYNCLLCEMISQHLWTMSVILGQFIIGMLVEAHVRLAYVPGDDTIKSCGHALKLMKGIVYLSCIPLWWLIPLSYNNPIGNEPVWEKYATLSIYGDGVMICLCCLYAVELLYVSIPTIDIITGAHHVGTLLAVYSLNSDWFLIWAFPVILYGFCFLSGTSLLHLVSYVYHFKRDPSMYKWYRGITIWIILCVIFFHVSYARALVNSLAHDTPMLLTLVRLLLWGVYIVDHAVHLRSLYAINAKLKTRYEQKAPTSVLLVGEGLFEGQMITNEWYTGVGKDEYNEYME
jgi:hypothetical protein